MDLRGGVDGSDGVSGTLEKTADTEFTAAGQKSDDCADQTCDKLRQSEKKEKWSLWSVTGGLLQNKPLLCSNSTQ